MNRKTIFILTAVAIIAAFTLIACGSAATPAPQPTTAPAPVQPTAAPAQPTAAPAAQAVEIRWRTRPDNKQEQDVYQKISDEVTAKLKDKGITLKYDPAPVTGYEDKLKAEFSGGNAPDVVWIPGASTADYANLGVIADIMPLAKADANFKLTDYYDAPMKELQNNGKLWGLPRDISTLVIYYNKDLLKAPGAPDPAELAAKGEWNWDNFLKVAKAATNPDKKQYGFDFSNWWGPWGYFVYGAGGSFFNADRTQCALNTPEAQAGLQFMADLIQKDKVAPAPGIEGGVGETGFLSGQIAMFPNGRWMTPGMRENAKFDWGVVEMPKGKQNSTWLFWGPYVMNAKLSPEKQKAAWEVMKALTSPEVQAQVAALGANIPSNKDKAAVDAFLNSKPPADNTPFIKGAEYAQAEIPLYTGNWGDIVGSQYQPAVDKIIAGKATVADATAAACKASDPLFKK